MTRVPPGPRERPIVMTGPSVPMVMRDQKTQTRRIMSGRELFVATSRTVASEDTSAIVLKPGRHRVHLNNHGAVFAAADGMGLKPGEFDLVCRYSDGVTSLEGDAESATRRWRVTPRPDHQQKLWVQETFSTQALSVYPCPTAWYRSDFTTFDDPAGNRDHERGCANGPGRCANCFACELAGTKFRWKSPRFMPRPLSRAMLLVTHVTLERLQDITEADAIAEGCLWKDYGRDQYGQQHPGWSYGPSLFHDECLHTARNAFAGAWNAIHRTGHPGPSPWDQSPWVWAIRFTRER